MLHKETVKKNTFSLLKNLINDPVFKDFNLAGGTALALYLGHRISIDLDLFTTQPFSAHEITEHLIKTYNFKSSYNKENTVKGFIADVKIDCIAYQYPNLKDPIKTEGVRLYSMEDITAMKLSAIADNGSRLKDFIDIACLSTKFSFNEMIEGYKTKYPNSNPIFAIKGIQYHNDIRFDEEINIINSYLKWDSFKDRINEMINSPNIIFKNLPIDKTIIADFKTAALNNDFKTIMKLKEKGFVYSAAIASELREAKVGDYAIIAIQNIFGIKEQEPAQANNPQDAVLREAIANSDFSKMMEMKNSGYKPSKEFMNELIQDKSIHDNTKIAINKIFGLNMIKHSIADIKLAKSEPEINNNQTKSKDNNLQK